MSYNIPVAVAPFVILAAYLLLALRMRQTGVDQAPYWYLFVVSITYGLLLFSCGSAYTDTWHVAASVSGFYLIFIAPVLLAVSFFANYGKRRLSGYYMLALWASIAYWTLELLTAVVVYIFFHTKQ